MDLNLNILRLASTLAAHSTARQAIVTENVAQADTPGYRARDIDAFSETLASGSVFIPQVTRAGHMTFGADPRGFGSQELAAFGAETPNGNSVSLEDQMMRSAESRQTYDLALGVYQKTMDILRISIGRNR